MRHRAGKSIAVTLLCAACLIPTSQSKAGPITQSHSYSQTITPVVDGASLPDLFVFDRFDSSAGNLDRVDVTISGFMQFSVQLPENLIDVGSSQVAVPYFYSIDITQSFSPFNFLNTPEVMLSGQASGTAGYILGYYDYSFNFSFDAVSDLGGLASVATSDTLVANSDSSIAIPPGSAFGTRSDFAAPAPGFPLAISPLLSVDFQAVTILPTAFLAGSIYNHGSVTIDYTYSDLVTDPNPDSDPSVSVPEPSTLVLFCLGLTALGFARFRRATTATPPSSAA